MKEMSRYAERKGVEVTVKKKEAVMHPWRTGSVKIDHTILQGVNRAAGCSCLDCQNKGFVPSTQRLQPQQEPQQDRKLFALMYRTPETLPKGYSLSCLSCGVQECILHRSAHLLSVSAFSVQEGLCCSKHIALFPPPPRTCWLGEGSMLRSNRHRCVDSAPGQRDKVAGRE